MLSRQELLDLLAAIGVKLPPKTKLSDADLDKRLSKTLDSAQYLSRVVPSPPLDPSVYPSWLNKTHKSVTVLEGIRRHNTHEAGMNAALKDPFPLFGNPFMDLRQTMMSIAQRCDEARVGAKFPPIVVGDEAGSSGIGLRVLDVRRFDAATPILFVVYRTPMKPALTPETQAWLQDNPTSGNMGLIKITATLKEQEMLLRLLKQNSKRLVKTYKPRRAPSETSFTLSFLLPVGPLTASDMAKHSTNSGCTVCGDPAKSKCSRCGVMRYCDSVCQKDDWKTHRSLCTSWQGGTWQRITFTTADHRPHGIYMARMSKFDIVQHGDMVVRQKALTHNPENPAPANTHGLTPFIVKLQVITPSTLGPAGMPAMLMDPGMNGEELVHIMVYDQKRAFDALIMRESSNLQEWNKVAGVVSTQKKAIKAFAWAVRTGEWTLDVCLDRFPDWQMW